MMNSTIATCRSPRTPHITQLKILAKVVVIMLYLDPYVSYNNANFSFGSFSIHSEKHLTEDLVLIRVRSVSIDNRPRALKSSWIFASLSDCYFLCFPVKSSSLSHTFLNFHCSFGPHGLLNIFICYFFFNCLTKFAPMCLMHHLLLTSCHFGTSPVSMEPKCKFNIALTSPAWRYKHLPYFEPPHA
jgi:hypothetical protein